MLTRLQVRGFKNLVDVDVRFGAFTCIAGPNAAGKSNLFDAILFLSSLADKTLLEAASGVRGERSGANAGRIFTRGAPTDAAPSLFLRADMIVPAEVKDDLDQPARPSVRFVSYAVELALHEQAESTIPRLELRHEELTAFTRGGGRDELPFARGRSRRAWLDSVLEGRLRKSPFISTERIAEKPHVKLHEDSGHQGRTLSRPAETLSRTVLSTINTNENPTALAARREMQSWRLLQLEPSKLRAPDDMKAGATMAPDGQGLAATLNRLLTPVGSGAADLSASRRAKLSNRLAELVEDVREARVDRDETRELLTVMVKDRAGVEYRARELSDGTLRFLALAVLELDHAWGGLLCLEEPENGIHPRRIPAMVHLLQDLAVDLDTSVDDENPLRQVVINTHSPEVVGLVPEGAILFACPRTWSPGGGRTAGVNYLGLPNTWRVTDGGGTADPGVVIQFLNALPVALREASEEGRNPSLSPPESMRRVAERDDVRQYLFPFAARGED